MLTWHLASRACRSPEKCAGEARFRTLDEYRQQIGIIAQGIVDIMLVNASSNEVLTINGGC